MRSSWLVAFVATLIVGFGIYLKWLGEDGFVTIAVFCALFTVIGIPIGQILPHYSNIERAIDAKAKTED